jgi:hypothetical protein
MNYYLDVQAPGVTTFIWAHQPVTAAALVRAMRPSIFRPLLGLKERVVSPDVEELSARLLAMETVLGQLVVRLAVHDEDPPRWVATRRALALRAAQVAEDNDADSLNAAISAAIGEFFDGVERAVTS